MILYRIHWENGAAIDSTSPATILELLREIHNLGKAALLVFDENKHIWRTIEPVELEAA